VLELLANARKLFDSVLIPSVKFEAQLAWHPHGSVK
jgi:hypothetical protein